MMRIAMMTKKGATKLLPSDGISCRCDDVYESLKPDGEERFWPEYVLK